MLAQFADSGWHEQSDGRRVVFIFAEGFTNMLKETLIHRDYNQEAFLFEKVSNICKEEIFNKQVKFTGYFSSDSQDQYM